MSPAPSVQEYSIRVPKNVKKKFHVMRFNPAANVDFTKWSSVKMERENNIKEYKNPDEEQPKFGAGSVYGREAREEARRKKYGIVTRKYKPEDQPWILKIGGKTGKKFKGIREGGVAENASYYVFTHAADGGIEAYPLTEWYNFQPIQRYKALSAEEAEQEFGRRNKVMNYFSLMLRKRLKKDEDIDGEEDEEIKPKKGGRKSNDLKISEMDDWVDSDEDDSDDDNDDDDEEKKEKKEKNKKKKGEKPKPKKQKGSDESAFEESDDGDEEGRELDYISDSSESASDHEEKATKEMKGVAEESALRRLLTSDEDEDEEEKEEGKENEKDKDKDKETDQKEKDSKKRKKKKKQVEKKKPANGDGAESSSDSSGDSSDSETEGKNKDTNSASNSRAPSPVDKKADAASPAKKPKLEVTPPMLSYGGENGITEEAVRRYLMRKPMTATELLQKFKGRKTGLNSDQLVNVMTQILKRINPVRQTIKNKMYLSIKPQPQQ